MPTSYLDQFFEMDPANPPARGTQLTHVMLTLTDQNDDGDLDAFDGDSLDGVDITASYPGDRVTIRIPGVGNVTYEGTTFYLADGRTFFTPTDGQILEDGAFRRARAVDTEGPLDVNDLGPPCFVSGTLIETESGPRGVETLEVGDRVWTVDSGLQAIRWIGSRKIDGRKEFAPIRFAEGCIGNDKPLYLSPQHRVLIEGWRAEMLFGMDEVLVAAKHLVDDEGIRPAPRRVVEYHHFLCSGHELVWSNGCVTESFYPGDTIMEENQPLMEELEALFPNLASAPVGSIHSTVRPVLRGFEARALQSA